MVFLAARTFSTSPVFGNGDHRDTLRRGVGEGDGEGEGEGSAYNGIANDALPVKSTPELHRR
jgi:hypothetical protein